MSRERDVRKKDKEFVSSMKIEIPETWTVSVSDHVRRQSRTGLTEKEE